jgi:uncharacterized membrane protein
MFRWMIAYLASLIVFLIADGIIIVSVGAKVYRSTLREVLAEHFRVAPIVCFYLLFTSGLCYFAIVPALGEGKWQTAAIRGVLYGLFTYSTYALTCYAAIRNWTLQLAMTDLCGGTLLSGAVAVAAFLIAIAFNRTSPS